MQPPWKTVWRFLKKLKVELPYDPEIPLLGIDVKKKKPSNLKRYTQPNIHYITVHNFARTWKQPKCPWTEDKG